jgi:starvation-inducible DNA-binding protein
MLNSDATLVNTFGGGTRRLASANSTSLNHTQSRGNPMERSGPNSQAVLLAVAQLLADTVTLRDLYAKHGEQASGPLARVFALICQRHRVEHARLVELLTARVRTLGGVALIMSADIAATTNIPRPPRGRESMVLQIKRLLNAHERIASQAIALATTIGASPEHTAQIDETALIASEVVLTGKLHVWLLAEHLKHASNASSSAAEAACIAGRLVLPFC